MPRKIGQRILQPCAIVEARGGASSVQVRMELKCDSSDIVKYMQRAVILGLMTVNTQVHPHWYEVVPGWRGKVFLVENRAAVPTGKRVHRRAVFTLQSVW